jgi:lysylphosphatidylglycerol synthetase-like protein (DUF2156 family)
MNCVKPTQTDQELLENHHQWFVQAFESGIMDHDFTVKSALIGAIALFTGHGLLLSSDVAWVVAVIGAILATAMAHVQRIGATLLLGISLGFRSDRFRSPWLFDIATNIRAWKSSSRATVAPQDVLHCHMRDAVPLDWRPMLSEILTSTIW